MTLLAAATIMTGANAQETERIDREEIQMLYSNSEKTDSLYNFWNTYVQIHPKDEVGWCNLFDVSENKVFNMVSAIKEWNGGEQLHCPPMPWPVTMSAGYNTSFRRMTPCGSTAS